MAIDNGAPSGRREKSGLSVLIAEGRCVVGTLVLLARNEIALPVDNVGREVGFADGSRSEVYRETAMRKRQYPGLVLLVVRFRLRFIGTSRLAHWLFRLESLLNTLLFAAHRGFQTKLWLTDRKTWFYRGIYEWEGEEAAVEYAETLRVVLRPWVQRGSFAYRIIRDLSRVEYLDGAEMEKPPGRDAAWAAAVGHAAASADEPR
jgi:hypothetical protein